MSKNRKYIILECIEQKKNNKFKKISRYYTTKNKKDNKKLKLKKYNYILRKRTIHEEI
ncbi:MAG: 50S ribosomal protein L33 [Candidatus Shikimatogenerans sp. JK-2022]|nr:50S ribosomal protein L33 [Candidatus Shikimatogenerans bostrichidophilus]MDH3005062.1 50S ribosomal protein L33 [Candidatus Shikimatogenerans bostrichidophilus]